MARKVGLSAWLVQSRMAMGTVCPTAVTNVSANTAITSPAQAIRHGDNDDDDE